ncbi:hypothetical protein MYSTI_07835 [Myxococcus stipitatus DSM 14675]|uniref:Uncharacterized protein n=1 Tax=Myxococcus stipitatus (strain DSM 14675 / JCM 12634 / Mx s8) TaxID=1278073 RepID=L7UNE8_MYXSD|nr:hypothetical protein MYSTI_07835 [Myxococcus stipitatus DSM 14675]
MSRHRCLRVSPVCPSIMERDCTPGDSMEWDGMTSPSETEAPAGNSASCLGFPGALAKVTLIYVIESAK